MRGLRRLDVKPGLFGGVLLMRQWGRVWPHGRCLAERFEDASGAYAVLLKQATRKQRRGYSAPILR